MAIRTTAADVKAINGSTLADAAVDAFILPASQMIDKVVANGCAADVDDPTLKSAETFLTCHIMATTGVGESGGGGLKTKEQFENYTVEFERATAGDGVLGTSYGKIANSILDGCLVDLDKRKAQFLFAGGA